MNSLTPPRQVVFDETPEIFATEGAGTFFFPLEADGHPWIETEAFDEVRFVVSLWYPSEKRTIDLDRAYVELRACLDAESDVWVKLAEIEPVVPPYAAGDTFDGWIVLPVFSKRSAFALAGSGFEGRSRVQIRVSGYFVA